MLFNSNIVVYPTSPVVYTMELKITDVYCAESCEIKIIFLYEVYHYRTNTTTYY